MGHPSRDRPRRSVDLPEAVLEFLHHEHMARRVTATEGEARILALLDGVSSGDAIEITVGGRVVARLLPDRICFRWEDGHAFEVDITDYH